MLKTQIHASEALRDVRAGLDDAELMAKYDISSRGLQSLFRKLIASGLLEENEIEARMRRPEESVILDLDGFPDERREGHKSSKEPRPVPVLTEDSEVAELLKDHIETYGLVMSQLAGGMPDTELIRQMRPTLVIADLSMPSMDIDAVLKLMKEAAPSAPILLLAEAEQREAAIRAVQRGAFDFVERPVDARVLLSRVDRALEHGELLKLQGKPVKKDNETGLRRGAEIIDSRDFLKGMLKSCGLISIIFTDLDQRIIFWNQGAENIFGYTAEEMIGSKVTRLYPSDSMTKGKVDHLRREAVGNTETVHTRMKQLTKDGRVLSISLSISPMFDHTGKVMGLLGVGMDITEEVRQSVEVANLLKQVRKTQDVAIMTLAKLAESRGQETGAHLVRIKDYCRVLCNRLATREELRDILTEEAIEDIVRSSVLHDIGKVSLPDSVLWSKTGLHPKERELMQQHPVVGGRALEAAARKLRGTNFLTVGRDVAYYHHERWDGLGYPFGIKGKEIPLCARIVALADAYDTMLHDSSTGSRMNHEEAAEAITAGKGKEFDPVLTEVFPEVEAEIKEIAGRLTDD
jgi:putative two-component system response regulator